MKPIIIIYTKEEEKRPYDRFDNFIPASFWIGAEYGVSEGGNVKLVRIEMYSADEPDGLDDLKTFVTLLLDRGIDEETRFFKESPPSGDSDSGGHSTSGNHSTQGDDAPPSGPKGPDSAGYASAMEELKERRRKGSLSEKEYQAQYEKLIKRWTKDLDDRMHR